MNKPTREPCKEPCRTCENFRYCGLERRAICTDNKKKKSTDDKKSQFESQLGQSDVHKFK